MNQINNTIRCDSHLAFSFLSPSSLYHHVKCPQQAAHAMPNPNPLKKEAILTAYKDALGHLVDLVNVPDNKLDLMDEQEACIAQWEKTMEGLLSTSLAITEAGLVLSLENNVHEAIREGDKWAKLWKAHLELTDTLEAAVNTAREKEESQPEVGPSPPEAESLQVEIGAS
ncbi:hypothetical protein JVT61DRAFT_14989 [Boletus reticuloceps]|uniref:Uncharacterized protein n=1 Tax=Boletus reticuloceps TaxID=495285 RepID=A0A8I2YCE0_9AGAM|nr:hypothetical protein JVT61DRAFT_14989 [Boletus reticuloceps]